MYKYLLVLTIASMMGLQTWRTLFNNFAVDLAHLEGNHVGIIQVVREIPGFLALLAIFVIRFIKEYRLSAIAIMLLGGGVALTGFYPSFSGLIATTLIMSFGFHYFETTNQSLTLQYFDKQTAPWVFGKLRSMASMANIIVGLILLLLTGLLSYRQIFLAFGAVIVLAGFRALFQKPADENLPPQHKKMIVRRKYWLYCFLTFMAGALKKDKICLIVNFR